MRRLIAISWRHGDRQDGVGHRVCADAPGGEIVNADSRQVYRGMAIGTAKPNSKELRQPSHQPDRRGRSGRAVHARGLTSICERRASTISGSRGQRADRRRRHRAVWLGAVGGLEGAAGDADQERAARSWNLLRRYGPQRRSRNCSPSTRRSAIDIDLRNTCCVIRAIEVTRETGRPFSVWQRRPRPKVRDVDWSG